MVERTIYMKYRLYNPVNEYHTLCNDQNRVPYFWTILFNAKDKSSLRFWNRYKIEIESFFFDQILNDFLVSQYS